MLIVAELLVMLCLPAGILLLIRRLPFLRNIGAIALCYACGFLIALLPIPYDRELSQTVASVLVAVAIPLILFGFFVQFSIGVAILIAALVCLRKTLGEPLRVGRFLLAECFAGLGGSLIALLVPGVVIFAANGILTVLTTVFLTGTVDYAELQTGHREESVIFSMQTFVVKLASGIAAFIASICLSIFSLQSGTEISEAEKAIDFSLQVANSSRVGLRMTMTIIPIIGLIAAVCLFKKKFILDEVRVEEINKKLEAKR